MAGRYGNNPYGTLGPSGVRVNRVDRARGLTQPQGGYLTDPGLWNKGGGLFGGRGFSGRQGDIPSMADRYGSGWRKKLAKRGGGKKVGGAKVAQEQTVQQIMEMLGGKQKTALDALLADSARSRQGEMMSLAGFGAALQGYSHDLWGQTNEAYRNAAAQQQSIAQGLGGQIGSGVAEMRAQQAALAGGLGHSGETNLATPEAAAAQVASEGGAETGKMMGQVGTAWGGYGATRPEYIGFMTGQNQMQLAREGIEADRDLRSKFLELSMDNPKEAQEMWLAMQENKRSNVSTSIAMQTLKTNIAMQRAQITQKYAQMKLEAKTDAEKLRIARMEANDKRKLDQQELLIDQQTADARTTSAGASVTSANASAKRAENQRIQDEWKRNHPNATGTPEKYAKGPYQQKVASAMYNAHNLFDDSGQKKAAGRSEYAFRILWPQMQTYIPKGQQKAAEKLLRQRLLASAKMYKAKPSSGGGGGEDW